jgi:hypothetical protein
VQTYSFSYSYLISVFDLLKAKSDNRQSAFYVKVDVGLLVFLYLGPIKNITDDVGEFIPITNIFS